MQQGILQNKILRSPKKRVQINYWQQKIIWFILFFLLSLRQAQTCPLLRRQKKKAIYHIWIVSKLFKAMKNVKFIRKREANQEEEEEFKKRNPLLCVLSK